MTASVTPWLRNVSASVRSLRRIMDEISCGEYAFPSMSARQSVPMWRLTEVMVRSGFMAAWRSAMAPTRRSPSLENATAEGVVRSPSALTMTSGCVPSTTATQLLVVPRSIPMTAMVKAPFSRSATDAWLEAEHERLAEGGPEAQAAAQRARVDESGGESLRGAFLLVDRSAMGERALGAIVVDVAGSIRCARLICSSACVMLPAALLATAER